MNGAQPLVPQEGARADPKHLFEAAVKRAAGDFQGIAKLGDVDRPVLYFIDKTLHPPDDLDGRRSVRRLAGGACRKKFGKALENGAFEVSRSRGGKRLLSCQCGKDHPQALLDVEGRLRVSRAAAMQSRPV